MTAPFRCFFLPLPLFAHLSLLLRRKEDGIHEATVPGAIYNTESGVVEFYDYVKFTNLLKIILILNKHIHR